MVGKKSSFGKIILFNGTSSSGKSAIIREFIKLRSDYKVFRVDDWFPAVLEKKAAELGWQKASGIDPWLYFYEYLAQKTGKYYFATEVRKMLFRNSSEFYQQAKDAAIAGQNVIIDTVFEYDPEYEEFVEFFKDFNVIEILVYCPLDILLKRVEERNKEGVEMRTAFQSFEQFPEIYKLHNEEYGNPVDVVQSKPIKDALNAAIQDLIDNDIPVPYLPKLEEFRTNFIKQFKLNAQEMITLVSRHKYDIVVNSGLNSVTDLAQQIANLITQK